jgi:hypothetical protein
MQAMENSVELDYVTEKVYQALEAGCVPIYFGAPNVNEYIPDMEGIIDYSQLRSPSALLTELERLANNQTAYEQKLAWKQMPLEKMSPGGAVVVLSTSGIACLRGCADSVSTSRGCAACIICT